MIIVGYFSIPYFFIPLLVLIHLCEGLDCFLYLVYSPFVLLISTIFYALSRVFYGNIKENLSETRSNNSLIMRLFLGIGLIILGFIFYGAYDLDLIAIFIGLFFILSSIIQLIINYFKNKKSID